MFDQELYDNGCDFGRYGAKEEQEAIIDHVLSDDGYDFGYYADGGDGTKEEQEYIIDQVLYNDGYVVGQEDVQGSGGGFGGAAGWRWCRRGHWRLGRRRWRRLYMAILFMMMVLRCRVSLIPRTGKARW
ncbi:unnamed protein product [Prorocentrum cordatum]|uniref:Uncharacterized protein n=1 Tax=Prorocentrum cordatum TaxID=2364126 RepID=A0ABN9PK93_9DINO|nr:unnamed protein product [Polarella glacialis]